MIDLDVTYGCMCVRTSNKLKITLTYDELLLKIELEETPVTSAALPILPQVHVCHFLPHPPISVVNMFACKPSAHVQGLQYSVVVVVVVVVVLLLLFLCVWVVCNSSRAEGK